MTPDQLTLAGIVGMMMFFMAFLGGAALYARGEAARPTPHRRQRTSGQSTSGQPTLGKTS